MSTGNSKTGSEIANKWVRSMVSCGKVRGHGMSPKAVYGKWKDEFDRLAAFCAKSGMDAYKYVAFCVGRNDVMVPSDLCFKRNILQFCDELRKEEQYRHIVKTYMADVDRISDEAVELGVEDTEEYLNTLVSCNMLGVKYIAGKISKYYLATINNFCYLYDVLDPLSKDTLEEVRSVCGELNSEVQQAFSFMGAGPALPIKMTDTCITRKQTEKEEKQCAC